MYYQVYTKTSLAFDNEGNRDTSRDDWEYDYVGFMPDDTIEQFCKNRFPNAFSVKVVSTPDRPL